MQFEVEPIGTYYKTYMDDVITGSLLDATELSAGRGVVGSVVSGCNPAVLGSTLSSEYRLYSNFKRSVRILPLASSEIIYDSRVPHCHTIYKQINGGNYVKPSILNGGLTVLGLTLDTNFGALYINNTKYYNSSLIPVTSSDTTTNVADSTWTYSFPFDYMYESATRDNSLKPKTSALKTINETNPGNVFNLETVGAPSVIRGDNFIIVFCSQSIEASGDPKSQIAVLDFSGYHDGIDFISSSVDSISKPYFTKAFYGFGHKFFDLHTVDLTLNTTFMNYQYTDNFTIAGWKFGIYNAFETKTKAIYRTSHYGFYRDMLEPRLYTKVEKNGLLTEAIIKVTFTSGSDDYITASLPQTLNPNNSGIYHKECAVGRPWFDVT